VISTEAPPFKKLAEISRLPTKAADNANVLDVVGFSTFFLLFEIVAECVPNPSRTFSQIFAIFQRRSRRLSFSILIERSVAVFPRACNGSGSRKSHTHK